mgnify:CR=1 FL=1
MSCVYDMGGVWYVKKPLRAPAFMIMSHMFSLFSFALILHLTERISAEVMCGGMCGVMCGRLCVAMCGHVWVMCGVMCERTCLPIYLIDDISRL